METKNIDEREKQILDYFLENQKSQSLGKLEEILGAKEMKEKVAGHFYLAPLNIYRGQLLLAALVVSLVMAISVVRFGNDLKTLLFLITVSVVMVLPYLICYMLLRWQFSLERLKLVSIGSFAYTVFISLMFVGYASIDKLWGLMIIPVVLVVFYLIELRKLAKLFAALKKHEQPESPADPVTES